MDDFCTQQAAGGALTYLIALLAVAIVLAWAVWVLWLLRLPFPWGGILLVTFIAGSALYLIGVLPHGAWSLPN